MMENSENRSSVSAIILTFNEEQNLEYCLQSLASFAKEIFIVDSLSTDHTIRIAKKYSCNIRQHHFENQARQLNWALNHLPIKTKWIIRLDADEIITLNLAKELLKLLPILPSEITGLYVKRRVYFMGKWIKYGGYYPTWLLRIWRTGKGYCEERWVDEHIKMTEGKAITVTNDIIEENHKKLHWWIEKHNNYATREAVEMLDLKYKFLSFKKIKPRLFGFQEQRKRWIKKEIYAKLPLFIRPILYFIYRYFFKYGFLDKKEGLIWHFLQGFWYRFLVDCKIYEIMTKVRKENKNVKEVITELYHINL